MATSKNIIVGAASVFLGPAGYDKPAYVGGTAYRTTMAGANGSTSTGVGTLVTNWRECGYTQDGLEVTTDPTWDEVEVDQLLDAAKIFKSGMSVSISTTFAEATLENLLIAWGQLSTTVSSVAPFENELAIEGGTLGVAPVERGLVAIGNSIEKSGATNVYGERVYHAFRVLSVESSSHTQSRAEATTIPVTFRALPADNTRYGSVRDRLNV